MNLHATEDGSACDACLSCAHCATKGSDSCAQFCAHVNRIATHVPSEDEIAAALKWFADYAPLPQPQSMHSHGLVLASVVRRIRAQGATCSQK